MHCLRNLLSHVPKAGQDIVAAAMKAVFVIQAPDQVRAHWQRVTEMLRKQFPTAVPIMEAARDDVLAFLHFPQEHWRKVWSTNPLERLNKEIKRRTNVVGIFPNDAANGLRPTTSTPAWWATNCWSSRRPAEPRISGQSEPRLTHPAPTARRSETTSGRLPLHPDPLPRMSRGDVFPVLPFQSSGERKRWLPGYLGLDDQRRCHMDRCDLSPQQRLNALLAD